MKLFRFIERNTIIMNVLLFVFGVYFLFLIASILADNWLNWKIAFWIILPIMLIYSLILVFIWISTIRIGKVSIIMFGISLILSIINLITLLISIVIWIDLFDGKTNALLP